MISNLGQLMTSVAPNDTNRVGLSGSRSAAADSSRSLASLTGAARLVPFKLTVLRPSVISAFVPGGVLLLAGLFLILSKLAAG